MVFLLLLKMGYQVWNLNLLGMVSLGLPKDLQGVLSYSNCSPIDPPPVTVTDPAAPSAASSSSSSPILLTQSHDLLIESSHTKTDRLKSLVQLLLLVWAAAFLFWCFAVLIPCCL
jgi:hypothetical protein